jgi:hypothetical protein
LSGLALIVGLTLPLTACDDTTKPPPPEPGPQIGVERHYKKQLDGTTQVGLQSNDVYDVMVASNNALWVGTQEGATVFGDISNTRRTAAFDQNNGLPNPKIRTIVESNGKLFIGTWGGGIGIYDMGADSWETVDTEDGLANNQVSDLAVDDDGAIIAATNGGVSRYEPGTGVVQNFLQQKTQPGQREILGDLLDEFVSAVEIAHTPRGKEYWYMPRWEGGIEPDEQGNHGITVARGAFNAPIQIDTLVASMDNTIYENGDTLSNGAGQYLAVGKRAGARRRALMHFDMASVVPSDASVVEGRLFFRTTSVVPNAVRIYFSRLKRDWGEGASNAGTATKSGAPAAPGDATWANNFYPGSDWNTPGGDYVSPANTSISIFQRTQYSVRGQLRNDMDIWAHNPSLNFGWILYTLADADSVVEMASRENPTADRRPMLEVQHSRYYYMTPVTSALAAPNINDVYYDEAADLFYIAFATEGLAVVDYPASTWTYYTTDNGLPSNVVYSIAQVGGTIWVGTQEGVAKQLDGGSFRGYARGAGLPGSRVRRVYTDQPDRIFLALIDAGVVWVDPKSAE